MSRTMSSRIGLMRMNDWAHLIQQSDTLGRTLGRVSQLKKNHSNVLHVLMFAVNMISQSDCCDATCSDVWMF